jgi:antitoxin ParD1/3/4
MARTMTLNVRVSGALGDFVAANVGDDGAYENVSEYVRDLIRRDMERADNQAFDRLQGELRQAFAAPDDSYQPLDAATVIKRGRQRSAA